MNSEEKLKLEKAIEREKQRRLELEMYPPIMLVEHPVPGGKLEQELERLRSIEECYMVIPKFIRGFIEEFRDDWNKGE